MSAYKVATFDCYGTLVDWEGGVAAFLYDLARRSGDLRPESGAEMRRRWEEIQFECIQESYRPYAHVLRDSLRAWVGERGYRWNTRDGKAFEKAMQCWQPFPDAIPALRRVKDAGLKLGIVSNPDHAIMDHTLFHLQPLEFDHVVVAEDVRTYKPERMPFTRLLDQAHAAPEEVLHVASGFTCDIGPARELGMDTVWINRHRGPLPDAEESPNHEWHDLWGLAELVERE
ncbi:MAG: haloacid dehalogenase type II [Thermoleophilaceae bacterium]